MNIAANGIILEGTLRRCKKYKFMKTKWVERYFVLYRRNGTRDTYSINEYKSYRKKELKKTFHLDLVNRVESNLSVSDPTLTCSQRSDSLNWILSIEFVIDGQKKDLYLAAENQELMNKWVREICRLCKLQRETDVVYDVEQAQFASSSITGLTESSDSLDASITEQHGMANGSQSGLRSDNYQNAIQVGESCYGSLENEDESEDRMGAFNFGSYQQKTGRRKYLSIRRKESNGCVKYVREYSSMPNTPSDEVTTNLFIPKEIKNEKRASSSKMNGKSSHSHRSLPRDVNYSNLMAESCSETSSMYSSRKNVTTTEDDNTSCTSGPPVPPPRTRYQNKFLKNGNMQKLNRMVASTSMGAITNENDSSGETLKMEPNATPYAESIDSSEGFGNSPNKTNQRAPPPIDRSNKPKNLLVEDTHYKNVSRSSSVDNTGGQPRFFSTLSKTVANEGSAKRKNLDYFEPSADSPLNPLNSKIPSTRSPTPSDIEYITVDVDRTLAFKQMRRALPSMD